MKTFAFLCLLLGIVNVFVAILAVREVNSFQPLAHGMGSMFLAFMMYSSIQDKGDPDAKA